MADGLLASGLNYIDQQKQALAARLGLLMSNPQEFAAQLGSEARQRAGVGLLGQPKTAQEMASGAWINSPYGQQAMQAGSGFAGTTKLPINNKNFSNWFKESKVVDENNLPLTVYTGSKADIKQFNPESSMPFGQTSPTFWFSSNPKVASGYAMDPTKKGESLGAVYPAKLSLQNPLVIDAKNNNWDNITINNDALKLKGLEAGKQKASTDYIAYIARQNGYDGLIIKNAKDNPVGVSGEISDVYTAFNPEQIKSIFNKGSFNPKDPRILYGAVPVSGSALLEDKRK